MIVWGGHFSGVIKAACSYLWGKGQMINRVAAEGDGLKILWFLW